MPGIFGSIFSSQFGSGSPPAPPPAPVAPTILSLLGSRVLRKLGITIVANSSRQTPASVVSHTDIAARSLRAVGANPATLMDSLSSGTVSTIDAVATAALLKLAVIASDDAPSSLDQAAALQRASSVHDGLVGMDYVTWVNSAIPGAALEYYIVMTANLLAPQFGKPASLDAFTAAQSAIRILALSGTYGQALAEVKVAAAHEELNALGIVTWSLTTIPAAMAEAYVQMASALLAPIYKSETPEDRQANGAAFSAGMSRIRLMAMGGPAGQALAEQKVLVAQYSLEARGRARWTIYDVPVWAEEPLVFKAAVLLAPEFGQKVDPSWDQQAEMDLMRIVSLPSEREPVRATYF